MFEADIPDLPPPPVPTNSLPLLALSSLGALAIGAAYRPPHTARATEPSSPMPSVKFRVDRLLATGGFGAVYRVSRHTSDKEGTTPLVLKVMRAPSMDPVQFLNFERRMWREAAVSAHLADIDGTVTCRDVCRVEKDLAILMDHVEGVDLKIMTSTNGVACLPFAARLHVAAEIARIVSQVHDATDGDGKPLQIIHRDLKPANIMVDTQGNIKVLDFGIAQARGLDDQDLTQGLCLGSPAYTPAEIALRDESKISPKSDVYSMGMLFAETLVGRELRDIFATKEGQHIIAEAAHERSHIKILDKLQGIFLQELKAQNVPSALRQSIIVFLLKMMSHDADHRPTSREVMQFFTQKLIETAPDKEAEHKASLSHISTTLYDHMMAEAPLQSIHVLAPGSVIEATVVERPAGMQLTPEFERTLLLPVWASPDDLTTVTPRNQEGTWENLGDEDGSPPDEPIAATAVMPTPPSSASSSSSSSFPPLRTSPGNEHAPQPQSPQSRAPRMRWPLAVATILGGALTLRGILNHEDISAASGGAETLMPVDVAAAPSAAAASETISPAAPVTEAALPSPIPSPRLGPNAGTNRPVVKPSDGNKKGGDSTRRATSTSAANNPPIDPMKASGRLANPLRVNLRYKGDTQATKATVHFLGSNDIVAGTDELDPANLSFTSNWPKMRVVLTRPDGTKKTVLVDQSNPRQTIDLEN